MRKPVMLHANNKGVDQPSRPLLWLRRLVCVLPGRKHPEDRFSGDEAHIQM